MVAPVVVAAFLATTAAAGWTSGRRSCVELVRVAEVAIPAPLRITTNCATYTVFPDGRVRVSHLPPRRVGITWMSISGAGTPVVQRGGRIAVLRAGREVWRSSRRFRVVGVFAKLGPGSVAFSYERYDRRGSQVSLYVAPLDGREREVARDERPLGWTRGGQLLTLGSRGLNLRASDGRLMRRVRGRLREVRFEPASRTVLALTRLGHLARFDGHRWRRLADLRRLGFGGGYATLEPLAGGLVGLLANRQVAVLRSDGSLFAAARFPPRRGRLSVAGNSGLVADRSGGAVAFAVTSGNSGYGDVGREAIYVLRSGDRSAREIYDGKLRFAICERWASLSWHRGWLLYATTEGKTLAMDRRGPEPRVDLSALVRRLAPRDGEGKIEAQVGWAS